MRAKKRRSPAVRTRFHREVKRILSERREELKRLMQNRMNVNVTNSTVNESSNAIEELSFKEQLIHWINQHRISKRAVNDLLNILSLNGIDDLPKDYRTLLQTPVSVHMTIKNVAGGQMWYNGLAHSLQKIFVDIEANATLSLKINIDGLPLYKSSKLTFYPILASIHGE